MVEVVLDLVPQILRSIETRHFFSFSEEFMSFTGSLLNQHETAGGCDFKNSKRRHYTTGIEVTQENQGDFRPMNLLCHVIPRQCAHPHVVHQGRTGRRPSISPSI